MSPPATSQLCNPTRQYAFTDLVSFAELAQERVERDVGFQVVPTKRLLQRLRLGGDINVLILYVCEDSLVYSPPSTNFLDLPDHT